MPVYGLVMSAGWAAEPNPMCIQPPTISAFLPATILRTLLSNTPIVTIVKLASPMARATGRIATSINARLASTNMASMLVGKPVTART